MKNVILALTVLIFLASSASAQSAKGDCPNDGPSRQACVEAAAPQATSKSVTRAGAAAATTTVSLAAAAPAPGFTSSPITPRALTDSRFINNEGQGLDTGCTYRSGGPLVITVPVDRVTSMVAIGGRLVDPAGAVRNGVVSQYATLRLPAFDIDMGGSPPEVDRVFFNGVEVGQLTGADGQWKLNEFRIPIELVRFGRERFDTTPDPGLNKVEVRIDQASPSSRENWCTAVDWVELSFKAMAPVIMVHGNNSNSDFFRNFDFVQPFIQKAIPYDASINLPTTNIEANGRRLVSLINAKSRQFGAHSVHIVAHSKGGLNSRHFLTLLPRSCDKDEWEAGRCVGVLSLTTLSTPHEGSAGADYQLDVRRSGLAFAPNRTRFAMARALSVNPGTPDLRVSAVQAFNQRNAGNLPFSFTVDGETRPMVYNAISADANLDDSEDPRSTHDHYIPTIQRNEAEGVLVFGMGVGLAERAYRLLGEVLYTTVEPVTLGGVTVGSRLIEHRPDDFKFMINDFAVTDRSGRIVPTGFGFRSVGVDRANHATIARPSTANSVISVIQSLEQ
jgi:pimeloyl-ACP methyl ester carboxylesterase